MVLLVRRDYRQVATLIIFALLQTISSNVILQKIFYTKEHKNGFI